jgi:heme exporter protein A
MSATLDLVDLACVRGGRALFSHVNRQVRGGELLRVNGANGAGKSSLLRMVCGLLAPASGQVLWRGEPPARQREALGHDLVYLGHTAALKDDLGALENLQSTTTLGGHPASGADALRALADAGLRGHEHMPVRRLSQGQRQRAALARLGLAAGAALWVLDEPFNALDATATGWLAGLVRAQLLRGGMVVLTSHQGVPLDDVPHQVLAL